MSKTDTAVGGIVDAVVSLEECVAIDEVETGAGDAADISNDEVDASSSPADSGVEGAGPDLSVGSELVRFLLLL